jgi:hypothetical protein
MSEIIINLKKGNMFTTLQKHGDIYIPIKKFINDIIETKVILYHEKKLNNHLVSKKLLDASYKITVIIEKIGEEEENEI